MTHLSKSQDSRESILAEFKKAASGARLITFDLFDTLLFRCFDSPTDLFRVMGNRLELLGYNFAADFERLRVQAERTARKKAMRDGQNEVQLTGIYAILEAELQYSKSAKDLNVSAIMALECELEIACIRSDPRVKAIFDELIGAGSQVALVSDMYLPRGCIEAMLRSAMISTEIPLFLSSETGLTKAHATIWPKLRSEFQLAPNDLIVHLGDNPESDHRIPQRHGVSAFLLPRYRTGRAIRRHHNYWLHGSCRALLQQSSVQFREDFDIDPYWLAVGHLVVLPAVIGMAGFVKQLATETPASKVFFLARDGLIFRKAYNILYGDPSAPAPYVWSSRRCLNIAMIEDIDEMSLDFIVSGTHALSPEQYVRRVEIDPADPSIQDVIRRYFPDSHLPLKSAEERGRLRAMFRTLGDAILAVARRERSGLLSHLESIGIFSGPAIVVDLGWHGSLQASLLKLGKSVSGTTPRMVGAYLGTFKKRLREIDGIALRCRGWLFEDGTPAAVERATTGQSVAVIELLFSAPESGIRYVELTPEGPRPVRTEDKAESFRLRIAALLHAIVEDAVSVLRPFISAGDMASVKLIAIRNLASFLSSPTTVDGAMFQGIDHADGFGAAVYQPIVPSVPSAPSLSDLLRSHDRSFWRNGFCATLQPSQRAAVKTVTSSRRLLRKFL